LQEAVLHALRARRFFSKSCVSCSQARPLVCSLWQPAGARRRCL